MAKAEYLTNAGQELLAQAAAGLITLNFTKIQMGDGTLSSGQSRRTMTALINPVETLDINSVSVSSDNVVSVDGIFDNSSLAAGFYYREKGVFASDGETEVLMFYMNSGDDAEWIEPPTVELVEKRIVSLYKGSQEESYSISTKSGIYVTSEEYDIDMGSDSISGIGNGTVKGAISSIRAFIANLEQSIASQAYAKGEYLVKGNSLRKVISAIASGGAITNSNTSETDVGKELTQINNSLTEINVDLTAVMDKHSYTVHELNKNANSSQITISSAYCVTYDYQALAKVDVQFTLSTTRAPGALMSFKNVFPSHISWSGVIMDSTGAPKSRCYLQVGGSDDGDGNVWMTSNTSLPAGSYYINSIGSLY